LNDTTLWIVGGDNHSHDTLKSTEFIKLDKGSVDLLSHFTKVKCDSLTWFFCVVLVMKGIPATGVKRAWATSTH
jgi:hypothetical protein